MVMYTELPLFRDTYQLILKVFECTKSFPREYRHTLGQDMKRDALSLVRYIYRANKSGNRVESLDEFLDEFELLKLELRLSVDMKLLSIRQQSAMSGLLERIGKQVTGWRKSSVRPEP